jgi:hypothetical protein
VTPFRTARLGRAAAVVAVSAAALLGSGGVALADSGTEAADVNLLNNLNLCPDVTAGLGLGNLLGLLGEGTANPVTNGGDVLCVIDDRDRPAPGPGADPDA